MRPLLNFFIGLYCVSVGGTHILLTNDRDKQLIRIRAWATRVIQWMGIHYRVSGVENLQGVPPAILVSNHASMIDIPLLFAAIPRSFRMVAKRELLKVPFIGWVILRGGFIPIHRQNREEALQSLTRIREHLDNGIDFYLAAEGTRSKSGELLPFKKGPFVLAIELGVPIVPVTLKNTHHAIPKKSLLPRSGVLLDVVVHPPVSSEGMSYEERSELRDRVREIIADELIREG